MKLAQTPTREERLFARQVDEWLREQSLPSGVVLWVPHWDDRNALEVANVAQLEHIIAAVEAEDYGGIRMAGDAKWAQVKCVPDHTKYLELHPYRHGDGCRKLPRNRWRSKRAPN